jgi:hypothetical protein
MRVTLEIEAEIPQGAPDNIVRTRLSPPAGTTRWGNKALRPSTVTLRDPGAPARRD